MDDEGGHRRGAGKRTRGAGGGYGAGMRARSASGGGRAHKEAADPMREAAVQEEEDTNAIERAQREARIVQLAITCARAYPPSSVLCAGLHTCNSAS